MGTYEARPGGGAGDYTNPSPAYPPGSEQGDEPTGTLTSEVFTIGDYIGDEVCSLRSISTRSSLPFVALYFASFRRFHRFAHEL